jgi:hypothetical protein
MNWELVPNKSLGDFSLGESFESVREKIDLNSCSSDVCSGVNWDEYSASDDNIFFEFEDGKLIAIMSYKDCKLNGMNLIGMTLTEVELILSERGVQHETVLYEDGDAQTSFEYMKNGLIIWCSDALRVKSISMSSYVEE